MIMSKSASHPAIRQTKFGPRLDFDGFRNVLKDTSLRTIKSLIRNSIRCPSDFMPQIDRSSRAVQKAIKEDNQPLFDEAAWRISSRYGSYCHKFDLFENDDNRRFKPIKEDEDQE